MANETEIKVNEYLKQIGVAVNTVSRGETIRDNDWMCDAWNICFARNGKAEAFEYYTGMGHRVLSDRDHKEVESKYPEPRHPETMHYRNFLRALESAKKPKAPEPAGLIYSVLLDGAACDEAFEDWCSNFGYDTDSRRAMETYLLCQSNYNKFRKLFSRAEIETLRDMLQDY